MTACCTQQMHLLQVQGRRLSTHPRCAQTQRSVSVSASICGPPQRAISLAAPVCVCVGVCMFVGVYVLVGHPGLSLPFFFIFIFCVDEFVRRSNCHQSLSAAPPTCVPFPVPVPDNHSSQLHTHTVTHSHTHPHSKSSICRAGAAPWLRSRLNSFPCCTFWELRSLWKIATKNSVITEQFQQLYASDVG